MKDESRKNISILMNEDSPAIAVSPENTLEALADFLAFLHAKGSITDSDIATLYHAALMRQGKGYNLGCVLLQTKFNAHEHGRATEKK